jgi:thymidine kinase
MFIEPAMKFDRRGWIEVICGSMFSGKTEELIRRLRRARIAKQRVGIFKPISDTRHHQDKIISHDENSIPSISVSGALALRVGAESMDVIGIDEAQFFDDQLSEVCVTLALKGVRVIVAGLDMDYLGNPFGQIPVLLSQAEYITKLHAICVHCGNIANYSYRKTVNAAQFMLGNANEYEPRCRICFEKGDLLK